MKILLTLLNVSVFMHISYGNPLGGDDTEVVRQRSDNEVFGNTRQLVQRLAEKLRDTSQQTVETVGIFSRDIQREIESYTVKINKDIQILEGKVTNAIKTVSEMLIDASGKIGDCIESRREQANVLIKQTYAKAKACTEDRVTELHEMINNLNEESHIALNYANALLESIRNCSIEDNGYMLNVGLCLGSLALKAQITGVAFIANSGISIARINLAISTLPAAFEICAGSNILGANVGTAKIIMEISGCSAATIISSLNS